MITTIDDNSALEVYIQVPLDRSPDLRLGLPVQILDADGKVLATNPITFVAPRVDDATQTVLVKSALREVPPTVRDAAVRAIADRLALRRRPDGSAHRRHAHQRQVLLLRRGQAEGGTVSPGSGPLKSAI